MFVEKKAGKRAREKRPRKKWPSDKMTDGKKSLLKIGRGEKWEK